MNCSSDKKHFIVRQNIDIFISSFICFENNRNVLNLLAYKQHEFSARNNTMGPLLAKLGISASFFLYSIKTALRRETKWNRIFGKSGHG